MRGASLRVRFLALAILGVAAPLLIVGVWLARSSAHAGERLVRSELETSITNAATFAESMWRERRSDVLLLAENAPMRRALAATKLPDTLPAYVRDAYAGMPSVDRVVVRSRRAGKQWMLGDRTSSRPDGSGVGGGMQSPEPVLVLRAPIPDSTGQPIGDVEAWVRASTLLPSGALTAMGSPLVAMFDRSRGVWSARTALPADVLDRDRVKMDGQSWLVLKRSLDAPGVDIVALGTLDPVVAPFRDAARRGFVALFVVAVLVVTVATVMTTRLTASLGRLARAADSVASGNLDGHVETVADDEVGRVTRAFNAMLASLKRSMEALSQREALAAVGELAATVAHQVRSPATAIKLDLQLADAELPHNPGAARTLVQRALSQVARLERAVTASLRIARTGSGAFTPVDVGALVAKAGADTTSLAQSRGVDVHVRGGADRIVIQGDEAALAQMIGNVLTNAVEAARSRVEADVIGDGGYVEIRVCDDGAGMPEEVRARLGAAFVSSKPGGTGLGLAVARRVAAAHRGEIRIERSDLRGTVVIARVASG